MAAPTITTYKDLVTLPLKQATLLFFIKEDKILLAMKKRGFGKGRWNGAGGKVEAGETVEAAAIREAEEEIGLKAKRVYELAHLTFYFPLAPIGESWDVEVTVYGCTEWEGELRETEEMSPQWFNMEDIPYDDMWSDDVLWLPEVLEGKYLKATFMFDPDDSVIDARIEDVRKHGMPGL
jgi:8-oxo-dGTP pyrophosphatase MutT (NUDIX family)